MSWAVAGGVGSGGDYNTKRQGVCPGGGHSLTPGAPARELAMTTYELAFTLTKKKEEDVESWGSGRSKRTRGGEETKKGMRRWLFISVICIVISYQTLLKY